MGDRLNKTVEEIEVLKYGLFVLLHNIINILLIISIGFFANLLIEMAVITICSTLMKRYSGGVHASTPGRCTIIGLLFSILAAILCIEIADNLSTNYLIILLLIGFIFSYIIIYEKCPAPSKNKPLKKESTKKLHRSKCFNLVNTLLITIILLGGISIYNNNDTLKSIMISIFMGIFIQVFALSKIGNKTIITMDKLLGGKVHT